MKAMILLVEDDVSLSQTITTTLQLEDYTVVRAGDGDAALRLAYDHQPDLILLDLGLPGWRDGRSVCRDLRTMTVAPILIISVHGVEQEKVERLSDGADDFLSKPFGTKELLARIHALLRRTKFSPMMLARVYQDKSLDINFDSQKLLVNGKPRDLSPKIWRILELLVKHKGSVVSQEQILRTVWGAPFTDSNDSLKVFITHLRKGLGESAHKPRYIHTARGKGYSFRPPE